MLRVRTALALTVVAFLLPEMAQAQVKPLLNQLPAEANSVLLVNAKALRDVDAARVVQRLGVQMQIPETADQLAMSTEFDLQHMAPLEQVAALNLNQRANSTRIARAQSGFSDRLGEVDVVWLERACLFMNQPEQITLVSPVNRQSATRWARKFSSPPQASSLSPFLSQQATAFDETPHEVQFSLDLTHVFPAAEVKDAVANCGLFEGDELQAQAAEILGSLQGVSVDLDFAGEKSRVRIVFGQSIASVQDKLPEMIRRAITAAGANLPGMDQWTTTQEERQLILEGKLTSSVVQRVLALNTLVLSAPESVKAENSTPQPPPQTTPAEGGTSEMDEAMAKLAWDRSVNYFKVIDDAVRDLSLAREDMNFDQAKLWISNYSRRISAMPTNGVESDLIEYGEYVKRSMEDMVAELQRAQSRINVAARSPSQQGPVTVTALPTRRINYGGHVRHRYAPMVTRDFYPNQRNEEYRKELTAGNERVRAILNDVIETNDQFRKKYLSGSKQ